MILYEKDATKTCDEKLIVGTVQSVLPVTYKNNSKLAVKIVDRDNKLITVLFSDELMDQAEKANITEGVFITVMVKFVTKDAGNALEFKYKGWWFLDSERNGKKTKTNVFVGPITSPKKVSDKCFMVSVPLDVYNKETKTVETAWKLIKFVNNQAAFAEKLLSSGTHYGAIVCGERQTNEYNGKTEYYYFGDKVELRLDANKENEIESQIS